MDKKYISFVAKKDFSSTQDNTEGNVIGSVLVGNISVGDPPKTVSGNSNLSKQIKNEYFGTTLKIPVYHCYGIDSKTLRNGMMSFTQGYFYFDRLFRSYNIGNKKIVGMSGKIPSDEEIVEAGKREGSCDILVFNSLIEDDMVKFPLMVYKMIGIMKPSLIVIGDVSKTKVIKFPVLENKTLMIGYNAQILYGLDSGELYKKID